MLLFHARQAMAVGGNTVTALMARPLPLLSLIRDAVDCRQDAATPLFQRYVIRCFSLILLPPCHACLRHVYAMAFVAADAYFRYAFRGTTFAAMLLMPSLRAMLLLPCCLFCCLRRAMALSRATKMPPSYANDAFADAADTLPPSPPLFFAMPPPIRCYAAATRAMPLLLVIDIDADAAIPRACQMP